MRRIFDVPDIGLCAEDTVEEAFRWHPLYRKHSFSTLLIVVASVYVSRHSKVRNFHDSARTFARQYAISRSYVTMDETSVLHVFTAVRHVVGAIYQIQHRQCRWAFLAEIEIESLNIVSIKQKLRTYRSWSFLPQKVFQISTCE